MKILVINNLSSGFANTSVFDFMRSVAKAGDEVVLRPIDEHSDFALAVSDCRDFDCVVAAGGDGTHSSVCYHMRDSGVPVLLYPAGTANLMTMNLESPEEPPALALMARSGRTLDFDLGRIDVSGHEFGFMMIAGCGYDAAIMSKAQQDKGRLGVMAYFKAAVETAAVQKSHFVLDIDGRVVEADGVGVLFLNFSKIQFDITLGQANKPRDGMLDVLVLASNNAWELLPAALGIAIDRTGTVLANSEQLIQHRGRRIAVQADPALPLQFDGEPTSFTTPFVAQVLPGASRLVVSEEGFGRFENP